jgi:WhiB family transcriptional regulator, redox-sensing transcriptional regulator
VTGQPSAEQIRRRRERDRVNHARARARAAGRDPVEIPGPESAVHRVVLPVSRAPQTGWQHRAACRTCPPQWFDAETEQDAARALAVCAGCQVRGDCFLAAAADRAESGVWGGVDLSAADRAARKAAAS